MRSPKLSIVMPVFNHPEETRVMVDSILAGSLADWELLAVDDGSEASTLQLLEEYAGRDSRIRLIHRDRLPKGAPTCRNIGLDRAAGEFLVFFDSDDYVTPHCLETRVKSIEARPELDFMVFPSGTYNDAGFHPEPGLYTYGYPIYADDLEHFARRLLPFVVWNNIYRTERLRRSQVRWDENLLSLQDADFNVSTILAGMRYGYASTPPDYGYRLTTTASVSKGIKTQQHYRSNAYAVRKMYQLIRNVYGDKYDEALLYGLLRIYNNAMTGTGVSAQLTDLFANEIADIAPAHARKLRRATSISLALRKLLPDRLARQLPMLPFLLEHQRRQRRKLHEQTKSRL